ncbi:oligosaccharide flippase family protein [Gallibacterium genomosp. 3]|uniref:oligosaccharide flippase family protein n=1 Tax=Gallibacterium genomosp. 3 TaxID=505345 RepID=UPI00080272CD|nr:oligosaccharide flippase family protein [Gallibacterium genomosp. 3]
MKKVIFINFIYRIIRIILGGVFTLFLIKFSTSIFSVDQIGKVDYSNSIITYFAAVTSLGINNYGIKEISLARNSIIQLSKTTVELLIIIFVTTIIGYIIFFIMIGYYNFFESIKNILLIMSINIFLMNMGINWFYIGIEDQKFITTRFIIVRFFIFIMLIYFVNRDNDIYLYVFFYTMIEAITGVFNIAYLPHKINFRYGLTQLNIRRHIRPLLTIFIGSISTIIYSQVNIIIISNYFPDRVAFFSIPNQIIYFIIVLITLLVPILIPKVMDSIKSNDIESLSYLMRISVKYILFVSFPIISLIWVMGDYLILIFSSNNFIESVLTFKILSLLVIVVGINNFLGIQVLYSYNKENLYSLIITFGLLINIILGFLLVEPYKEIGVSVALVVSEGIKFLLLLLFSFRYLIKLNFIFIDFIKYAIGTVFIIFTLIFIKESDFISMPLSSKILLSVLSSGIIYILFLLLTKEEMTKDLFIKIYKSYFGSK